MLADSSMIREVEVRYRGRSRRAPADAMRDPSGVVRFLRGVLGDRTREAFVVVYLDARHRPMAWEVVSVGTLTASLVHPREVFRGAVLAGAAALLVAHNHPSGDPALSAEDREVTARLRKAGEVLGVKVLDSLVVTESGYSSALEGGWLDG